MTPSPRPLLTLVTVVWNDHDRLLATARSLPTQPSDLEWLVVDGASTDNSLYAVRDVPYRRVISEPDKGLYDAMNKGIRNARGQYLVFINAGDSLDANFPKALDVIRAQPASLYAFGFTMLFPGGRRIVRKPRALSYMWHSLPTSHQAIVYNSDKLRGFAYRPEFRVSADYQLTAEFLTSHTDAVISAEVLAAVSKNDESFSQNNFWRSVQDCWIVQRDILGTSLVQRMTSLTRRVLAQAAVRLL